MELTQEDKKNIINMYLRCVWHIFDKNYQLRVWIKGEGPEVDDFDETCNVFFGGIDDVLGKYKDFHLTENQYQVLKKFKDELREFSDQQFGDAEEFIDTPEWAKIMERAKEVLNTFNYKNSE